MKFFANMSLKWTLASIMTALGLPSVILFYLVMAEHDLADMKSTLVVMVLYMMTIFTVAFYVGRTLLRKIGRTMEVAKNIAAGNLRNDIETEGTDECSRMLRIMGSMQDNLRERNKRAVANARIKRALDCVNANVMLADTNYDIVYLNDTVVEMFQNANKELRKELPNFDANKLMGSNIDVFHKNPAHQRRMLDAMTSVHEAQLNIDSRTFRFIATPVFTDNQERLGTVVEWEDLTEQLAADETERKNLQEQHLLTVRNGRVKQALDNVGSSVILTNTKYEIIYVNEAARQMFLGIQDEIRKDLPGFDVDALVGKGLDIFQKNTVENSSIDPNVAEFRFGNSILLSTLIPVKDHDGKQMGVVVEWVNRTNEIAVENEVQMIVNAALAGDLSQRIELAGKSGFLETLSRGINDMMNISDQVINDTSRVLSAMAQGNLSETIETDYQGAFGQLKHDANATVAKLTEVIGEIKTGADEINTGSDEISQGNTNLSQRTEEQASSLEETASSMEQMTGTVKQNADNAAQANQLASGARQQAEHGGQVVSQAVSAMAEINSSSKKIADIIGVIDEIAFQTNLLALNAAVEAARAGEQGRGFAVVATEVRNLAQRSATAAKEIKDLIQDSVGKVEDGSKLVDQSGQTLEEIVNSVKKVSDIVAEIAAASQEQSAGIEQVNKAIVQMDEMTQQNAALVEQAAAASESMSEQASGMNNLMAFFQVGEEAPGALRSSGSHPIQERRGAARPWSESKPQMAKPVAEASPPKLRKTGTGGADEEWEEF